MHFSNSSWKAHEFKRSGTLLTRNAIETRAFFGLESQVQHGCAREFVEISDKSLVLQSEANDQVERK